MPIYGLQGVYKSVQALLWRVILHPRASWAFWGIVGFGGNFLNNIKTAVSQAVFI